MYAIVRAGGRQEKVSVGDIVDVDRCEGEPGGQVSLSPLLIVGDEIFAHTRSDLAAMSVAAEIVRHYRGKKIIVGKFKNKTGYRRKQGHRQELTKLKITAIDTGK